MLDVAHVDIMRNIQQSTRHGTSTRLQPLSTLNLSPLTSCPPCHHPFLCHPCCLPCHHSSPFHHSFPFHPCWRPCHPCQSSQPLRTPCPPCRRASVRRSAAPLCWWPSRPCPCSSCSCPPPCLDASAPHRCPAPAPTESHPALSMSPTGAPTDEELSVHCGGINSFLHATL